MCTSNDNVSPYLRRPIRTYEEFLRDRGERATEANRIGSSAGTPTRSLPRRDADHVEPHS